MAGKNKPNPFSTRQRPGDEDVRLEPIDGLDDDLYEDEYDLRADEHKVFGLGLQQADDRQPAYGQGVVISLLSAAALLLLAIIAIGDGDGSNPPIFQRAEMLYWIIAGFVLLLTAGGAQYAEKVASAAADEHDGETRQTSLTTAWAVPFVAVAAAIALTATFHNRWMLLFGPLIAFLGTAGSLLSRDLLDEADDESARVASTMHTLVVHIIAFLAFSAIYLNKFDTVPAVLLVAVTGFILLLATLERAGIGSQIRLFYSAIGAWILATVMMALNWWPTWGWTGGAVLLAVFYLLSGLMLANAEGRTIRRRELVEYIGVASIALLILALRDVLL